jgi:hypothetical protein
MGSLLARIGGILLVADIVYLVVAETAAGGANAALFRTGLAASAVLIVGGFVVSMVLKAKSGITAPSCPRCGRRVVRGKMYCDDHLVETINRYRDEQSQKRE